MLSLPSIILNKTEQDQVQELLSQPIIKKYLQALSISAITNIVEGSPADSDSDSLYIRKEAMLKGQLALIETLLTIQPLTKSQE